MQCNEGAQDTPRTLSKVVKSEWPGLQEGSCTSPYEPSQLSLQAGQKIVVSPFSASKESKHAFYQEGTQYR